MPSVVAIEPGKEIPVEHLGIIGGKAFQQALAAADGLPVLKAFVLTTEAFPGRGWLEEQSQRSTIQQANAVREYLKERGIDLAAAVSQLPGQTFSFRSSATAEDMDVASFAGSFTTKLNVKTDQMFTAVYEVWASTFSQRLQRYLGDRNLADHWESLKMAVLIQPMVQPLLSGVALSHPLGEPQHPYVLVTVVRGLGEKLVSGEAEPQSYQLERGTWSLIQQQDAFDTKIVYEAAAEVGRAIEFLELRRGVSQDIEFAIDRNCKLVLLQNRPIVSATRV